MNNEEIYSENQGVCFNGGQQKSPIECGCSETIDIKNCFTPTCHVQTLNSPCMKDHLLSYDQRNKLCLNFNPLFSHITSPYPCKPDFLHRASINGDSLSLQHVLSEGGLCWLEFRDRLGRTPLMYACLGDWPECVTVLLNAGASPLSVDNHGRNAFHWAARKGLYRCLKLMHKHENKLVNSLKCKDQEIRGDNFRWRVKDKNGATPLHLSTCATSPKCCGYILKCSTAGDVECQDAKKRTPLHWASAAGNAGMIRMLLKSNARVDVMDENGKPPLFYAISSQNDTSGLCSQVLLEKSPDFLFWNDYGGRCALHLAIADQPDGTALVEILIESGKIQQMKDTAGKTPMHWAVILEKILSLIILLKYYPDMLLCQDNYGGTALHYAAMSNFVKIMRQIVLTDDNSVEVRDTNGQTPIFWAAGNNSCEAVEELVNVGAKLEHLDKAGQSALHVAVMNGSTECVKLLLQLGADVNTRDKIGNTPIAAACEFGHLDIFLCLKDNGASVETENMHKRNPIHLAVSCGHSLLTDHLTKTSCDLNYKDTQNQTPLHIACSSGQTDCASVLLERGAQHDVQDDMGWTPLHNAVYGSHCDLVQLLLGHSADISILTNDGKTVLDVCYESGSTVLANQLLKYGALPSQ